MLRSRRAGLEARIPSLSAAECLLVEETRSRLADGASAAEASSHVEEIIASGIGLAALREFVASEFCDSFEALADERERDWEASRWVRELGATRCKS
jgi:hypothetical protein